MKYIALFSLGSVLLLTGGWFGICSYKKKSAIEQAQTYLKEGFPALAFDEIQQHKKHMVDTPENCAILLQVALSSPDVKEVSWAAEACAYKKYVIKEIPIALATAANMRGDINSAISIISNNIKQFESVPDLYYTLAKLHFQAKNTQAGVNAIYTAHQKAPENLNLAVETLSILLQNEVFPPAGQIATKIMNSKDLNLEVQLLILSAFKKAELKDLHKSYLEGVKQQLGQLPAATKEAVEKNYAEVLN